MAKSTRDAIAHTAAMIHAERTRRGIKSDQSQVRREVEQAREQGDRKRESNR